MANVQTAPSYAEIPLAEGEVICPNCRGFAIRKFFCNRCYGAGKLDWVEMVVGKEEPCVSSSFSSNSTSSTGPR